MALSATALIDLTQAKNYLRVDTASSLHVDAEYVGVGTEGGEDEFPLIGNKVPISGSLKLYVENVLQDEDTNFSIASYTITFKAGSVPGDGDIITASYDYTATVDTFESYDDLLIEDLIEAATKKAEDYVGRAFVQREITETHIGDNKQVLRLYKRPVVDVDTITIGGESLTSWSERLSIGRVYHLVVWPEDYEIVVVYTAGYGADRAATQALVPDAVTAVLIAVATWYENRLGVKSQNISGVGSIDYGDPDDLPEASKKKIGSLRVNVC